MNVSGTRLLSINVMLKIGSLQNCARARIFRHRRQLEKRDVIKMFFLKFESSLYNDKVRRHTNSRRMAFPGAMKGLGVCMQPVMIGGGRRMNWRGAGDADKDGWGLRPSSIDSHVEILQHTINTA